MAARPPTKSSTPRLSEIAQHVRVPAGVTSSGWPSVRDKCRDLGIAFRPWQPDVGRLILAKRSDGKYAATIGGTGLSIPRQVGKTFLVGAIVFALCLLFPKLTVIWTAHRLRTAEETFGKMQAFAKRKKIAPHVAKIVLGSGDEEIVFKNGSRILFGARERGFGRGFDEVDVLIFDEGQILTDNALDDMIPATNQSRQQAGALLLFMGTPPKPKDPSEVWVRMRTEVLSGEDQDTGWVEFGCDPDHEFTPLPAPLSAADWKQIAKANPSFPDDTPREAILRMRKKLGPESFDREGAGRYDEVDGNHVFAPANWSDCSGHEKQPKPGAIGLAVSLDRRWGSIGAAGATKKHTLVGAVDRRQGTGWMVAEAKRIQGKHGCRVVVAKSGPAADLIPALEAAGVEVTIAKQDDEKDACAGLYDAVQDQTIGHGSHDDLDAAVDVAQKQKVGDRWRWRRSDAHETSMLEAVTLALWGLSIQSDPPPDIF